MSKTHEQKFTDALRDIFVGARIEGDSGYINLMRIKSRYYTEGVFPRLMEKIETEIKDFPVFREELFDKLYTFFKRYFSESGSIYFRHTPYYQDIYERIYTDDRDVMLFWKTQNLYYVKTDRLFRSVEINLSTNHTKDTKKDSDSFRAASCDSWTFFFDASELQNKRNNEKRGLVFNYEGVGENETLKFSVDYAKGAAKTKTDEILKAVKKDGVKVNEDQLTRAFGLFERQSEVDFFINKNARAFLNEQFDLWMYQYLFKNDASEWKETRLRQMQALKRVARAIIEFVAQFEDELVRIWNKPKFALRSNYVITFDRVFGRSEDAARKLLAHEGIAAQIEEWRTLGIIDEEFTIERIFQKESSTKNTKDTKEELSLFSADSGDSWTEEDLSTKNTKNTKKEDEKFSVDSCDSWTDISEKYRFLPFDTKHFKSLETEILALFDNLDEELDGRLVHSENYQALNTLKDKFRERVKCIYTDPPYNTSEFGFAYVNDYRYSSWLSMIENRLTVAQNFLPEEGVLGIAIDDSETHQLRNLLDEIFGRENRISTLAIEVNPAGQNIRPNTPSLSHDYCHFYTKNIDKVEMLLRQLTDEEKSSFKEEDGNGFYLWDNLRRRGGNSRPTDRPKQWFPLYVNLEKKKVSVEPFKDSTEVFPIDPQGEKRIWRVNIDGAKRFIASGDISVTTKSNRIEVIKKSYMPEGRKPKTLWKDALYSATTYGTKLLDNIIPKNPFSYPKSLYLVQDCIKYWADEGQILDFFGGSGTTAHAVINLNREDGGRRKYILVEANDYFHTVILPRVKKVVFSDKWKNGAAQADGKGASHFCKYFALEQYEDTLRRASYVNDAESDAPSFFDNPFESPFASYVFLRDKKMADALHIDYEADRITVDFKKLYPEIDWAETLSCIKGKFIKSVSAESVTFADGETVKFDEIDYRDVLPLIWWDK